MQVAAAMFTPASLIAAATCASAPGLFSMSMARSNGIQDSRSGGRLGRCARRSAHSARLRAMSRQRRSPPQPPIEASSRDARAARRALAVYHPAVVPEAPLEQTESGLVAVGEGWFVLNARAARWHHHEGRGARLVFGGDTYLPQ